MTTRDFSEKEHTSPAFESGPISWWSWRPGIKPLYALLLGLGVTFVALLLLGLGLLTLVAGILDSFAAPLKIAGVVTKHTMNPLSGQPQVHVRLHTVGFPATITPDVTRGVSEAMHDGDSVFLEYTPRLHALVALEDGSLRVALPGSSIVGDEIGSVALILLGLLLLPYPALLARWALRDVFAEHDGQGQRSILTSQVIALRETASSRANRPGLTPHLSRAWHGVALRPDEDATTPHVLTFSITREMYTPLKEGMLIRISYSPHIHYVYSIEQV